MKFFKSNQQAHSPFKVIKYYYHYGLFIIHRARTRTRARYLPNIYIFIFFIYLSLIYYCMQKIAYPYAKNFLSYPH